MHMSDVETEGVDGGGPAPVALLWTIVRERIGAENVPQRWCPSGEFQRVEASRWNDRPAIRTLSTTTSAARVRIEILFQEMVALGERLREAEKAYAEELGDDSSPDR